MLANSQDDDDERDREKLVVRLGMLEYQPTLAPMRRKHE